MKMYFASVAEAKSFFYNLGYETVSQKDRSCTMKKGDEKVFINHIGLLEVEATF